MCVLTLATSHPVVSQRKHISRIDFLADVKSWVDECSELCHIHCTDESVYSVHATVRARLIETNQRLVTQPHLLADKPNTEGFLAMLLPRKPEHGTEMRRLSTADEYERLVMEREKTVL